MPVSVLPGGLAALSPSWTHKSESSGWCSQRLVCGEAEGTLHPTSSVQGLLVRTLQGVGYQAASKGRRAICICKLSRALPSDLTQHFLSCAGNSD